MNLQRLPGLRILLVRPRLVFSILSGLAVWMLLPASLIPQTVTRALIAWNTGSLLYLFFALIMMARSSFEHIRLRAHSQDEGKYALLTIVTCSSVVTLCAIAIELSAAKDLQGAVKAAHVLLAVLTVFTTWSVIQTMFALHYAHDYHLAEPGETAGLDFPGEEQPDYMDFLYAAAIIGTSGQTADVSFNTSSMRRIGLLHSVLSFFFNTILLALTINIAAGLL
jgi:uncharacterized membrane protein